jgi:hypothetical protein
MSSLEGQLNAFKTDYDECQGLLRHIDLLLEAHKQLTLATMTSTENCDAATVTEISTTSTSNNLEKELVNVQKRIKSIEEYQKATKFLSTCSIPSVAASPIFYSSLSTLFSPSNPQPPNAVILDRCSFLMKKCWDNALVAMERVLERDLISLEAYLDDQVYREIKEQVIIPLIRITKLAPHFTEAITHFTQTYAQLRENFVTLVLDGRLNSQFSDSHPKEQVLHLIERTRLLMVVEQREYASIFNYSLSDLAVVVKSSLNRILESIGNLMFSRIEGPLRSLSASDRAELSAFVNPLMESVLTAEDSNNPFGLFLKLLSEKFSLSTSKDPKPSNGGVINV